MTNSITVIDTIIALHAVRSVWPYLGKDLSNDRRNRRSHRNDAHHVSVHDDLKAGMEVR